MYDTNTHSFCSEFYTIEKSIEVVVTIQGQNKQIRIDALRNEKNRRLLYSGVYRNTPYSATNLPSNKRVV